METQVGDDVFAHQDEVLSKEEIEAWLMEAEEWKNESQHQLPEELWSSADLDTVPPDPPKRIDDLAEAVEEERLQRMKVLERIEKRSPDHKNLTTRFVRDWRMKSRPDTGEKMWLRRSSLVAREYANDVRMEVHSPASP